MDPSKLSSCITPITSEVLDAKPSCLEFVPLKHNPNSQFFVVGTYTLLEDAEKPSTNEEEIDDQDSAPRPAEPQANSE
jgi:hypothetical protein